MNKYYYEDKYKTHLETKIADAFEDNGNQFIKLEDCIYYPQGGGQKGDKGYIIINNQKINIINSIKDDNYDSIQIIDKKLDETAIGKSVECYLDWDYRLDK